MVLPGDGHDALLDLIPEARREILKTLKLRGPLPVEAVAEKLDITVSGARQHLTGLERDGVVTYRRVRRGPGRPRHLYELTDLGDALFPRNYADLAAEILGYVGERAPALLEEAFSRRTRRRLQVARGRMKDAGSLEERVEVLVGLLEEEGYMPRLEVTDDGAFRIVERNCLVEALAGMGPHPCASELVFMRKALPDAEVERVAHAANDQGCCSYDVRPASTAGERNSG